MCGIYGFLRTKNEYVLEADKAIRDLTYFNRLRGIDALGVFKQHRSNKQFGFLKDVGDPYGLIQENAYKAFMSQCDNNQFFVMHNRLATRGNKEDIAAAHPYQELKENGKGHILMVHNGTITTNNREKEFPGITDSHSLAKMLAAGVPLKDIYAAVWGAWALVWLDTEDNSLHFWRNKDRPFGFVHSEKSIWFGSEIYMVGAAMDRQGIAVNKFERLVPMEEWIWHWDAKSFDKKKVPEVKKLVGAKSTPMYPNGFAGSINDPDLSDCGFTEAGRGGSKSQPKTKVEPYTGDAPPFSLIPPHVKKRDRNHYATGVKPDKWGRCKDGIDGWEIGDTVSFSVTRLVATKRGTQVKMDGTIVTCHNNRSWSLANDMEVMGMSSMNIDKLDLSKNLFQGVISEVHATEKAPFKYRMMVRKITETDIPDPFHPSKVNTNPLEPKNTPDFAKQAIKSILAKTKTGLKESEGTSKLNHHCFSCNVAGAKQRIQEASREQDYIGKVLWLCPSCFNATMCDDTAMWRMFELAKQENLNAELNAAAETNISTTGKPFVHNAPQIQQ